jgi:hypothetical protein
MTRRNQQVINPKAFLMLFTQAVSLAFDSLYNPEIFHDFKNHRNAKFFMALPR